MTAITPTGHTTIDVLPQEVATSESPPPTPANLHRRLPDADDSDTSEASESSDSDDEVMPVRADALTDRQTYCILMGINFTFALIVFGIWCVIVDRSGI